MEPEEIDKLFKDRLAGLPTTPSADAWLRLQQKMEPPKKERTMWLYYAAASIALLIMAGFLFFRNANPDQNQVAQTPAKLPDVKNKENILSPQATPTPGLASTSETSNLNNSAINKEAVKGAVEIKEPATAVKKEKMYATMVKAKTTLPRKNKNINAPTAKPMEDIATVAAKTDLPEPKLENSFTPVNKTSASENIVQVVVKLDEQDNQANENWEENSFRENLSRKGSLLKNIYKQARNLKNGEPVELAALGVNTEKLNAEKENIKLKINKVISL